MSGESIVIDRSSEALVEIGRKLGYDTSSAVLVRRGTNTVYRLRSPEIIIRISPRHAAADDVKRQIAVARWLEVSGIPAVRAVNIDQPIWEKGHAVTVWESVSDRDADDLQSYGTTGQLGSVLRQLHALRRPASLYLPTAVPLERITSSLDTLDHLEDRDRRLLAARAQEIRQRAAQISYILEPGPIHGDANVGNLLRARGGAAILSDLDAFSCGPREVDLVLTAMYADRYGWHSITEYREFVDAYGVDVRDWGGYEVLADARELLMVLWTARKAAISVQHGTELAKRLQTLRTGEGRANWLPL